MWNNITYNDIINISPKGGYRTDEDTLKQQIPNIKVVLLAMILGFFSYGLSIVLFVFAMRNLGSARTSAFFATSPFIGSVLAFILYRDVPNSMFIIALPIDSWAEK